MSSATEYILGLGVGWLLINLAVAGVFFTRGVMRLLDESQEASLDD